MAPGRRSAGWCYWLLEGAGHRGTGQLDRAALDGRGIGEFPGFLPAEVDGLAVEGGQVVEQVAVFADRELVAVVLGGVFVPGVL
jgi:hypothetical protein